MEAVQALVYGKFGKWGQMERVKTIGKAFIPTMFKCNTGNVDFLTMEYIYIIKL